MTYSDLTEVEKAQRRTELKEEYKNRAQDAQQKAHSKLQHYNEALAEEKESAIQLGRAAVETTRNAVEEARSQLSEATKDENNVRALSDLKSTILADSENQKLISSASSLYVSVKEKDETKQLLSQCNHLLDSLDISKIKSRVKGEGDEGGSGSGSGSGDYLNPEQKEELKNLIRASKTYAKDMKSNEDAKGFVDEALASLQKEDQRDAIFSALQGFISDLENNEANALRLRSTKATVDEVRNSEEGQALKDAGMDLLRKVGGKDEVVQVRGSLDQLKEDPHLKLLAEQSKQLLNDLQSETSTLEGLSSVDKLKAGLSIIRSRREVLEDIKDTVVRFLVEHIPNIEIPVLAGVKESSLGELEYELKNIRFSKFVAPPAGVEVFLDSMPICVCLDDISAAVTGFEWKYKQTGFPWLSDDGVANATVNQARVRISIDISLNGDQIDVKILDSVIDLKDLEVTIMGDSVAAMVYNALLTLFAEELQTYLEEKMRNALEEKSDLLAEWIQESCGEYLQVLLEDEPE
eukprot:Rmarinus@m.29562